MRTIAAEAKNGNTGKHVQRICDLTCRICLKLGMSPQESGQIGFFSMMHDVGKIHIPDKILRKPGPLANKEWAVMKTHTVEGERILSRKTSYQTAREIARSHHEHWDGSGYPDGLKGKAIPVAARIVTVADVFDGLIHARPYKEAWPLKKVLAEMKRLSGKMFDPEILEVFLKMQQEEIKHQKLLQNSLTTPFWPFRPEVLNVASSGFSKAAGQTKEEGFETALMACA